MRWILILLCACRFSWSTHMGAPARSANEITMTLYAADDQSMTLARSVLARDPHVKLLEFDPTVIEKQKTDCGTASCQGAVNAACSWSALQGAEYYAIASVWASYHSDFECTKYDSSLFDKHDDCVAGHEKNQASLATYTLDVYDVKTCQQVKALSQRITAHAAGPEEQSKPEALAELQQRVPVKAEALPDQIVLDAQGQIAGATRDGFYAVYRDGAYRGYVKLAAAGTAEQTLQPMYFPLDAQPGDALVARGRRKFVDLALDGAIASVNVDGEGRSVAGGLGLHVRHYALDGGLQGGVGVDLIGGGSRSATLVTGEVGWGTPIASGVVASANLGVGLTRGTQSMPFESTSVTYFAWAPHALATARLQTFLATFFYVTVDAGFIYGGTLKDWELTSGGASSAPTMTVRSPIARVYIGFDL